MKAGEIPCPNSHTAGKVYQEFLRQRMGHTQRDSGAQHVGMMVILELNSKFRKLRNFRNLDNFRIALILLLLLLELHT